MEIILQLTSPYKEIIKKDEQIINCNLEEITIKQLMDNFLKDNIEIEAIFTDRKIIIDNKLKALYILNDNLVKDHELIKKNSRLKLLFPICGG